MTITLIICIPITALVVGFLVLKSVQLGLRWQLQVQEKKPPTMESPLETISKLSLQTHPNTKGDDTESIMSEWLNGAVESR